MTLEEAIKNKIETAKSLQSDLLDELRNFQYGTITSRIKSEESILEKIKYYKTLRPYQSLSNIEILDHIPDIFGVTVVVNDLSQAPKVSLMIKLLLEKITYKYRNTINYISDRKTYSGYKSLNNYFYDIYGFIFEIQVTDQMNLEIREQTHQEFKEQKYNNL